MDDIIHGETDSTFTDDTETDVDLPKTPTTDLSSSSVVDEQEIDNIDETPIGAAIPNRMSNLFRSRLQQRRYEQEDQDFFDRLEVEESISEENAVPPVEPPAESWDDLQDNEGDLFDCHLSSENTPFQDNFPDNDKYLSKLEVLVLWLMLFLASWQSQYAITDTALTVLIKFISHFFWFLGLFDNSMAALSKLFPKSHYMLKKALGIADDDFYKYVVCPKCKSLYKYEDCFEMRSGNKVSAKCKFVPWPNHPHRSRKGIL